MTSTVRGPSAASVQIKNLHAWRNVVESCCTVCSLKTMFHCGCCSTSYWNLILHTFTSQVRPKCWAQADLPIFHQNVTGTSFRLVQGLEMHFGTYPDFPNFFGLLAPSARMWQQLLVVSQAEDNDLGRPWSVTNSKTIKNVYHTKSQSRRDMQSSDASRIFSILDKETAETSSSIGLKRLIFGCNVGWQFVYLDAGTGKNMQVIRAFPGKISEDRWHQSDMLLHDTGAH